VQVEYSPIMVIIYIYTRETVKQLIKIKKIIKKLEDGSGF
jgi:hypothetical protein